jgi:hypothetical protein
MSTIAVASFTKALTDLLTEVGDGPPNPRGTWIVSNEPASGVMGTADRVDAARASRVPAGCTHSLAGHVGHLAYALDLFVRAAQGEKASENAKWDESWHHDRVNTAEWDELRERLRRVLSDSIETLQRTERMEEQIWITGGVALAAHTAYHLGAIRQLAAIGAGGA